MKLYYGTNEDNYNRIVESGVIGFKDKYTYFSPEYKYALMHGDYCVVIDYEPNIDEVEGERLLNGKRIIQIVIFGEIKITVGETT